MYQNLRETCAKICGTMYQKMCELDVPKFGTNLMYQKMWQRVVPKFVTFAHEIRALFCFLLFFLPHDFQLLMDRD